MYRIGLILVFALVGGAAHAQVDSKEIAACAAQESPVYRLTCYDDLATRHSLAPTVTETTDPAKTGAWRTNTDTDPLNDKSIFTAILDAEEGRSRFGREIALVVRCSNNKTEMYIVWNDFLGTKEIRTTYRVDKNKAETSSWSISTNNKAAFFPGSPVPLLKLLVDSSSFVANVTPYNESPVTAIFNTTGAGEALADIRKGCNW